MIAFCPERRLNAISFFCRKQTDARRVCGERERRGEERSEGGAEQTRSDILHARGQNHKNADLKNVADPTNVGLASAAPSNFATSILGRSGARKLDLFCTTLDLLDRGEGERARGDYDDRRPGAARRGG